MADDPTTWLAWREGVNRKISCRHGTVRGGSNPDEKER
jgi:hypothetical protein